MVLKPCIGVMQQKDQVDESGVPYISARPGWMVAGLGRFQTRPEVVCPTAQTHMLRVVPAAQNRRER
jgi:hypothetical protein